MSNLTLDVALARKLKLAFARYGWTEEMIASLCKGDILSQLKAVLLGHAVITMVEHVINCDTRPYTPYDWSVEWHKKDGIWKWDPSHVELYVSDLQKEGGVIEGEGLRKELLEKPVMNANVLDYLLLNSHLIPEEWKGKTIFFWGTIYRNTGRFCVRCLTWNGDAWIWAYDWLNDGWTKDDPSLLRTC